MTEALPSHDEERLSRKRRYTAVILAVVVMALNNAVQIAPDASAVVGSARMHPILLGLEAGFWLAALYLVWFVMGRRGPAALNDELTTAHRTAALRAGYWCLLAAVVLAYAWMRSGRHEFDVLKGEHLTMTIASIGVVIPAFVFSVLERRAEKSG